MVNIEKQQLLLAYLGYYQLRRKDGTLAIDGLPGPSHRAAIYNFQVEHQHRSEFIDLDTDGVWGPETEEAVREVIGIQEPPQRPSARPVDPGAPSWWAKYPAVRREDWRCRCGGRFCNGFPVEPHEKTVAVLQKIADHFGKPILWNSGIRCDRYNASIPGASPRSKHRLGMAYDFHVDGVSPQQLADYAETLMPDWGGIGVYSWGIHLDDRPVRGRWRG